MAGSRNEGSVINRIQMVFDANGVERLTNHATATTFEMMGRIAAQRNENERASNYYERSAESFAELNRGDVAAELYQRAGGLAAEKNNWKIAAENYEQAVDLLDRTDDSERFLWAIDKVVDVRDARGEHETAMRWCDRALDVVREQSFPAEEAARTHFRLRLADVSDRDGGTPRTYDLALRSVVEGDAATAGYLLRNVWNRYETIDESSPLYRLVLAAGVGYVANGRVNGEEPENGDEILDTIEPESERLTDAAVALFELLTERETDIETEEFATDVDTTERMVNLGTLEEAAFGTLIEEIAER